MAENKIKLSFSEESMVIDSIRTALESSRGSSLLYIVGIDGSGKSSLLEYILSLIDEKKWSFPQDNDPCAIIISGKSFTKDDHLVDYISKQASKRISKMTKQPIFEDEDFIDYLIRLSDLDFPIIIMIDSFSTIMMEIKNNEVEHIRKLRQGGIHYILVSDYRPLEDISPKIYNTSLFFKDAHPIYLRPLNSNEIDDFITNSISQPKIVDSLILKDWLKYIAGGHRGLLLSTAKVIQYSDFTPSCSPLECEKYKENELLFLRHLLQNETIDYYLLRIINSVIDSYTNPREREILLKIASGKGNGMTIPVGLKNQFEARSLVDSSGVKCHSTLIQFSILKQISGIAFSAPESALFELLRKNRPNVVTFSEIWNVIKPHIQSEEKKIQTNADRSTQDNISESIINSTIARIRKKIYDSNNSIASINSASFDIVNERGFGFYMQSDITFDIFLRYGISVFQKNEEDLGDNIN